MREQLLQLEALRDWLKTPSFPQSGRIFDGSFFYRQKQDQFLIDQYKQQLRTLPITPVSISKAPLLPQHKVDSSVDNSNTWLQTLLNYKMKRKN